MTMHTKVSKFTPLKFSGIMGIFTSLRLYSIINEHVLNLKVLTGTPTNLIYMVCWRWLCIIKLLSTLSNHTNTPSLDWSVSKWLFMFYNHYCNQIHPSFCSSSSSVSLYLSQHYRFLNRVRPSHDVFKIMTIWAAFSFLPQVKTLNWFVLWTIWLFS